MTTVAYRARDAWLRAQIAVPADLVALAGLALSAGLLVALTWGTWGALDNDTGHDFDAGTRVAHGQLPYVDFVYWYGPLAPLLAGLAARIGGSGVDPFIGLGIVVALAIVAATYALARTFVAPLGAFLASALVVPLAFAPHQFSYVLPHTSAATLGLLVLLCLLLAIRRGSALGVGLAAGLATLTKPEFAAAALLAAAAWLLVERAPWRRWALVAGPVVAIAGGVYGAFAASVGVHRLLWENLWPRHFLAAAGNELLKARSPLTASSFVHLGGSVVLYAVGGALLVAAGRLVVPRRLAIAAAALLGLAAALADPGVMQHGMKLAYAWIPGGAILAAGWLLWKRRPEAPAAVCLAVLAFSTYASFYLYSAAAQMAVYAAPLAAIFLVRLHGVELARTRGAAALGLVWLALLAGAGAGLTIHAARAESVAVRGPGGALSETPQYAAVYQGAADFLATHTRRGDAVLLAPQMTWLYALAERRNPLPELTLLPGALTDERAAIRRLDAAGVRAAVVDERAFGTYGTGSFGKSFDPLLAGWLRSHFVLVGTLRAGGPGAPQLQLWQRRPPS